MQFTQRNFKFSIILLAVTILLVPGIGFSAGITVQSGASLSLGAGAINFGCTDLVVAGDFSISTGSITAANDVNISAGSVDAGSGDLSLSGSWLNSGTFAPGSSQVNIVDGCANSTSVIQGDTDFFDFFATSVSGKILRVTAASSQTFTNQLFLQGALGVPILIRSTIPGTQAFFNLVPAALQTIFSVDVQDNDARGGVLIAPGLPSDFNSINSGNVLNWFNLTFGPQIPIPTLSLPGILLLVLLLLITSYRNRHIFSFLNR